MTFGYFLTDVSSSPGPGNPFEVILKPEDIWGIVKKKKWKGCNKEHAVREKVIRVSGLVLYGWGTWGDKMWHIEGNKMHNLFYYCLNWNAHI